MSSSPNFSLRPEARLVAWVALACAGCGGGTPPTEVPWPADVAAFDRTLVTSLEAARDDVLASPEDPATWMRLGLTYEAHSMIEYASDCYESCVAIDEANAKAWYRLATISSRDGDVEAALDAFARVHALTPDYLPAHRRRGHFLVEIGRPEEARAAYEDALDLEPNDIASRLGLVEVELEVGRPELALTRLDAIANAPPSSRALAHRLRGVALTRMGRADEAAAHLELGYGAKPGGNDPWLREAAEYKVGESALLLRAGRLVDGGQAAAALELLDGLGDHVTEDPRYLACRGRALARLERWSEAAQVLAHASELKPDDVRMALAAASAQLQVGDADGALASAERILAIDPAHLEAAAAAADLHLAAGRIDDVERIVANAADRGEPSAALAVIGGKAALEGARYDDALQRFTRATELDPSSADAWAGRALSHLELGSRDAAADALTRLAALAPDHPLRAALEAELGHAGTGSDER
ncbi:MAG: tetratricopeptide repeat protein [Planctomycetota bacterium]